MARRSKKIDIGKNIKIAAKKENLIEDLKSGLAAVTYGIVPSVLKLDGWLGYAVAVGGTWLTGAALGWKGVTGTAFGAGLIHLLYSKGDTYMADANMPLWRMGATGLGNPDTSGSSGTNGLRGGVRRPAMRGVNGMGRLKGGLANKYMNVPLQPGSTVNNIGGHSVVSRPAPSTTAPNTDSMMGLGNIYIDENKSQPVSGIGRSRSFYIA